MSWFKDPAGIRMARVRITPAMMELFSRYRFFSGAYGQNRFAPGQELRIAEDAVIEAYANLFDGEILPMALGAFSYSYSGLNASYRVGRYCSIAPSVRVMGSSHPLHWVTTSPFSHHPHPVSSIRAYLLDREAKSFPLHVFERGEQSITVGHDVWIGEAVMLKPGITIGHGAAIAARAIVTRDVPPYAVVGGMPARIIRYRFPEEVVARMLALEWWRFGPDQLQILDPRDPIAFLDRLEDAITSGLEIMALPQLTGRALIEAGEMDA